MKEAFKKMEQKVHGQEEAIAQLYRFTGDHERKFCIVEKELNTTYKAVLEAQAEMAILHDRCCCCGVPGGRHCQATLPGLPMHTRDSLSPTSPTSYCQ